MYLKIPIFLHFKFIKMTSGPSPVGGGGGGAGGALAPPVFGRLIHPISTRVDTLITTSPPGFSDLATALDLEIDFNHDTGLKLEKLIVVIKE